jgi:hypothetical protein
MCKIAICLFICLFLVGCSTPTPNESVIQTAIAQTQISEQAISLLIPTGTPNPTNTPTVTSSPTPSPTFTPTFTPTYTQTSTFTPTSTPDLRVIDADPKIFLLTTKDLPDQSKYRIA